MYERVSCTSTACNSKNVVYMIQCKHCNKRCIGETKRHLWDRFNELRRPADKPQSPPQSENISSLINHTANDIFLIPLELINSTCDNICNAREAYLITRGDNPSTLRLNKKTRYNLMLFSFICLFHIMSVILSYLSLFFQTVTYLLVCSLRSF